MEEGPQLPSQVAEPGKVKTEALGKASFMVLSSQTESSLDGHQPVLPADWSQFWQKNRSAILSTHSSVLEPHIEAQAKQLFTTQIASGLKPLSQMSEPAPGGFLVKLARETQKVVEARVLDARPSPIVNVDYDNAKDGLHQRSRMI